MRAAAIVLALVAGPACGRLDFEAATARGSGAGLDAAPGSYAGRVLADDPRAYYRLDEGSAGDIAHDATGHGNDAPYLLEGGAITFGEGGALAGDPDAAVELYGDGNTGPNVSASVQLPEVGSTWAGDFTVEAFVRPIGIPPDTYSDSLFICEHYQRNGFRTGWTTDLFPEMWTDEGGGGTDLRATTALDPARWNHLAFVRSGATITIYQDGVLAVQAPLDYHTASQDAECGFGALHGDPSHADFDELAIYDRALTAAQIAAHVAAAR